MANATLPMPEPPDTTNRTAQPVPAQPDPHGLTSEEAKTDLQMVGPNSMPDTTAHPMRRAVTKLWAPVPWMLEAAIVLELLLHKFAEGGIIVALLLFNAVLAYLQEGKAEATLAALKSRLALSASAQRDGAWKTVPAAELVPGDLVKLSLGAVVAADIRITGGSVLVDQSMLTGESVPVELGAGRDTYAGALIRRGEATGTVTQTGPRTKFGHTAALVQNARVVSSQQATVLKIVRNLAIFNGVIILPLVGYALFRGIRWREIIPLVLTAVLASIPVALPATFTLASALGARALAKLGVLSTRLSAVDEAATMEVLCADKTGTLTMNELQVKTVKVMDAGDEAHLMALASLASADGGQDPVDAAIRTVASQKKSLNPPKLVNFIPFDPATKMAEASAMDSSGKAVRIVKGAYAAVIALAKPSQPGADAVDRLEKEGFRVLAVVAGDPSEPLELIGLISLSDPPRADAAGLIKQLEAQGVRTIMVTGDAAATATTVAKEVGLDGPTCPPGPLPQGLKPDQFAVFAGIFPEGKFDLVKALQQAGHTVGMCGDGANDAPALRQAQMGVAVSTATDVAKSAAGIVLTTAGLGGIVSAVREGRSAFQRILTYTLNSVTKKMVGVLFLFIGLIVTGQPILTPMLMVLVMLTGDILGTSVTTDNVRQSSKPNQWNIGKLTSACSVIAACLLAFCTGALLLGRYKLGFNLGELQALSLVTLVFGSEATLYCLRERKRMWSSRPGGWIIVSSIADVLIISFLAVRGIFMHSLPFTVVGSVLLAAVLFAFFLDLIKVPTFRRLQIA